MAILIICLIIIGLVFFFIAINKGEKQSDDSNNVDTSEFTWEDEETGKVGRYKRTPQGYVIFADMNKYDARVPCGNSRFAKFMEKEWMNDDDNPIVMDTALVDGTLQCYDSSTNKVYFKFTCPALKELFQKGYAGIAILSDCKTKLADNEFSLDLWVRINKDSNEEPNNDDISEKATNNEETSEVGKYKRTSQGYLVFADMVKFDALITTQDEFTDYVENEWMDEDGIPRLMETALIDGTLRCYNSSENQVYFEFVCPELMRKFQEGNYGGIAMLTDYNVEDEIKAEIWVLLEQKTSPVQGLLKEKEYEDHLEIVYRDAKGMVQSKPIKNKNVSSFITGLRYRENYEELLDALKEGMKVSLIPEPDNPYDPNAIAIYNGKDLLGYIPAKDIPVISLNMEKDNLTAFIDRIDGDFVGITIPATFKKLENPDIEKEYGEMMYIRICKARYEKGVYGEQSIPITREEFLKAVKEQTIQD
ncbi:MAG: HIRAN domain-containing protein [Bacteroidaceae bacterium]|nr:HIRAN domain-containing protein [Bacteroidaceae bacterium]